MVTDVELTQVITRMSRNMHSVVQHDHIIYTKSDLYCISLKSLAHLFYHWLMWRMYLENDALYFAKSLDVVTSSCTLHRIYVKSQHPFFLVNSFGFVHNSTKLSYHHFCIVNCYNLQMNIILLENKKLLCRCQCSVLFILILLHNHSRIELIIQLPK